VPTTVQVVLLRSLSSNSVVQVTWTPPRNVVVRVTRHFAPTPPGSVGSIGHTGMPTTSTSIDGSVWRFGDVPIHRVRRSTAGHAVSQRSEAENTGSGIAGAAFVANEHTISMNLNMALAQMAASPVGGNAPSFYTRANFPNINSAFMAYYQTNSGDTAYIPAPGDVDAYGADLYHKGPATDGLASSDPRFQGYVKAVHAKAGTNVFFAFPEYGVDGSNITDSQRESIIAGDYAYMTGTSSPGTRGLFLWNYWFELGNSGQQHPFSAPSSTASEWHTISN
jgi:hypothetical protein